jgi:integrase
VARRYQRGCVFKRGKKEKVWIGRWREDIVSPDGRPDRIQHSVMLGPVSVITSKYEAQTMLEDRLRQLNVCQAVPRAPLHFEAFFHEWQRTTTPLLRPATRRFYSEKANSHLLPYFGARRLTDIRTLDIQVFLNQKALKYSRSGLQHMKATLSRMFSDAVAWNYVRDNPVRNVRLPNARLAPPQPYLTPEQVRRLVFALREPYRTIVLTAVLTGLRPSELFGLYWTDLDFEKQTMQISRSYYMGEFGLPKTNKSRRTLLMPTVLRKALENHRESSKRKTSELVFSTRQGKPIDPSRVLKKGVYPVLEKLKMPRVGWRAFRHTVATLLQHMGVSVKVAQDQLGHSNPTTTLAIYTHALPEAQKAAVSQLAAQLFPDVPKLGLNAGK